MSEPKESEPQVESRKESVNGIQRMILLLAALLAAMVLLLPPWSHSGGSWRGYSFFLSPPLPGDHINSAMLFLELAAIGLITWFLVVATKNVRVRQVSRAAISIIGGCAGIMVLLFAWFVWPKRYTEEAGVRTTRLIGTRYVWSNRSAWITEVEKKVEDLADDTQRRNTAKPVLDELSRVIVERDDGGADHLFIYNPTHWSLPGNDSELIVEYYRQKNSQRMLLKIAENYLTIAPGINDIYLNDASNLVGKEPLVEKIKITANSARAVGGEVSPTALVPSFMFEYERICQTEYTQTKSDPLTDSTSEDSPYIVNYSSKVVCRRYK